MLAGASLNRPADEAAAHVLSGFARLGVHRDVPEGVRILRRQGLRLVTLTNGSADVAAGLLTRAGLRGEFERLLSVEDAASLGHPRRAPGGHAHRVDRQAANTVPGLLRRPRPASPGPRGASRADHFLTRLPAAAAWLRVSATQIVVETRCARRIRRGQRGGTREDIAFGVTFTAARQCSRIPERRRTVPAYG
jgi:hypothetical protein